MRYRPYLIFVLSAVLLASCSTESRPPEAGASLSPAFSEVGAFANPHPSRAPGFGAAVAIDGDTALVGGPGRYGEEGSPGLAQLYRRQANGGWRQAASLTPPAAAGAGRFGRAVALSGDTAAVAGDAAVYLYRRGTGGQWQASKILFGSDAEQGERFIQSVALEGTTLAVGEAGAPAVHIFERHAGGGDNWGLVQTITLADVGLEFAYHFGRDIDLSENGNALIISNSGSDDQYYEHASALVFERSEGGWELATALTPPQAPDRGAWDNTTYGWTVAIDGDTAVVGSRPIQGEADAEVFIYERDFGGSNNWGTRARHEISSFLADNPTDSGVSVEHSGTAVAVEGDIVLAGAHAYSCYQEGSYNMACEAGHVYVFERDQGGPDVWGLAQILQASNAHLNQNFGRSLAVDTGVDTSRVIVGARGGTEDAPLPGMFIFER